MAKTKRSYRFSDLTISQIAELASALGADATEIIEKSIDRMYREEIKQAQPVEARRKEK